MRLLIDTHIFLWFVTDDVQLSDRARRLIADPAHDIFVSVATLWEMAIKVSVGKLHLTPDFTAFATTQLEVNNFSQLPIATPHLIEVARLPLHHRDPFDRLLIAQSLTKAMPLLSSDAAFDAYGVQRLF